MHPIVKQIVAEHSARAIERLSILSLPLTLSLLTGTDHVTKYLVRLGDTLGGLALRFETTVLAIQTLNRLPPYHQLSPGEVIFIIPQYLSSDMDSIKSLVMNLEINRQTERYTKINPAKESPMSIFRFGGGYSSWGESEEDLGFENPQDKDFFHSKQEEYATHSVVPHSIRCYLRIKTGFMKESFSFRKYQTVWCALVDQHLLIFRDIMERHPIRIIYLYGACWRASSTASTLCFSFEVDPYGTGNIAKLFYKLETPQEAKDWFDLFELLTHNSIGTSTRDNTQLSFGSFFRDITTCEIKGKRKLEGKLSDPLQGSTLNKRQIEWIYMVANDQGGGMKYTGDCHCDDAIDAVWDIDNGKIAHEESIEVISIVLNRCRNMIAQDDENEFSSYHKDEQQSYADPRIKTFLLDLYSLPNWVDFKSIGNGASLLLTKLSWLFIVYIDFTLVELICTTEGTALSASIAALTDYYANDSRNLPRGQTQETELITCVLFSSAWINSALQRLITLLFRAIVAAASGCLRPSSAVWNEFLELRLEIAILRRKIFSVFGPGRWDEKQYGMPLSQYFMGYCLGLFAVHSVQTLQRMSGSLLDRDILSILQFWAYLGHLLGIAELHNPCLDNYSDLFEHVNRLRKLFRNPILEKVSTDNPQTLPEAHLYEKSPQIGCSYDPTSDPNYSRTIIKEIHKQISFLPAPDLFGGNWSCLCHANFTRLCLSWSPVKTILVGINIHFSFLTTLYLMLLILWSKILTISGRVVGKSDESVNYCRRLEKVLALETSELNREDVTGARLWHDSDFKISTE